VAGAHAGGVLYVCGADGAASLAHALAANLLSLHGVAFHASHAAVLYLVQLIRTYLTRDTPAGTTTQLPGAFAPPMAPVQPRTSDGVYPTHEEEEEQEEAEEAEGGGEDNGRKSKRRRADLQADTSAAMHAWSAAEARMDDAWGGGGRDAAFAGVASTSAPPQHLRFDNVPRPMEMTHNRFAMQPHAAMLLQQQQQQQQWPWGAPMQMGMQPPGATYSGGRPPPQYPPPRQHPSSGTRMQQLPAVSGQVRERWPRFLPCERLRNGVSTSSLRASERAVYILQPYSLRSSSHQIVVELAWTSPVRKLNRAH